MSVDMVYSHVSRFRPQGGSETAINYNGCVAVIIPYSGILWNQMRKCCGGNGYGNPGKYYQE